MPEISRFFGIFITLNFNDHNPPHFHARYGDYEGIFDIQTLEMIEGDLPKTAKKLVRKWSSMHKIELLENWNLIKTGQNPINITPLE